MFGNATVSIPDDGVIGPSLTDGLSDELAVSIGRIAALTLSEPNTFVTVTLECKAVIVIGHDENTGSLIIGWSHDVIRRFGGFREYAAFVGGPII
jgi:hypothetical protein